MYDRIVRKDLKGSGSFPGKFEPCSLDPVVAASAAVVRHQACWPFPPHVEASALPLEDVVAEVLLAAGLSGAVGTNHVSGAISSLIQTRCHCRAGAIRIERTMSSRDSPRLRPRRGLLRPPIEQGAD